MVFILLSKFIVVQFLRLVASAGGSTVWIPTRSGVATAISSIIKTSNTVHLIVTDVIPNPAGARVTTSSECYSLSKKINFGVIYKLRTAN